PVPLIRRHARPPRSTPWGGQGEFVSPGHGSGGGAAGGPRHEVFTRQSRPFGQVSFPRSLGTIVAAHSGTRFPPQPLGDGCALPRSWWVAEEAERPPGRAKKEVRAPPGTTEPMSRADTRDRALGGRATTACSRIAIVRSGMRSFCRSFLSLFPRSRSPRSRAPHTGRARDTLPQRPACAARHRSNGACRNRVPV